MKKFILILAVAGFQSVLAQTTEINWENLSQKSNRLMGKLTGTVYVMSFEAGGHHFLHKNWVTGTVETTDGDQFENVAMRYMAYKDELVVYNKETNQLFIPDKEKIQNFSFDTSEGKIVFVTLSNGDKKRYYQLLYEGKGWLLAFHNIYEQKVNLYADQFGILRDTRWNSEILYYMYLPEKEQFYPIKMNRRSIFDLFPDRKKELRRIFRSQNHTHSKEQKITKVFGLMEKKGFFDL